MFQSMTEDDFRLTFNVTFIWRSDRTAETLILFIYEKFHTDTLKLLLYVILINFF